MTVNVTPLILRPDVVNLPAVSWILCTHVANDQLREALQSCFDQSYKDFECIVVANGESSEEVADTVRSWFGGDSRLCIFTTDVRHLTFSLALGLHHARAPLVARMDGDDISSLDRLMHQVAFMNANPQVSVLGTQYVYIDSEGKITSAVKLPTDDLDIRRRFLLGNPFCHSSVMFRRNVVVAIGGYLGGIYAQDYDLWTRLALDPDIKFANLPSSYLKYRVAGVGTARKAKLAYASVAASQFRNFAAGAGWRWGFAALRTVMKIVIRSILNGHSSSYSNP